MVKSHGRSISVSSAITPSVREGNVNSPACVSDPRVHVVNKAVTALATNAVCPIRNPSAFLQCARTRLLFRRADFACPARCVVRVGDRSASLARRCLLAFPLRPKGKDQPKEEQRTDSEGKKRSRREQQRSESHADEGGAQDRRTRNTAKGALPSQQRGVASTQATERKAKAGLCFCKRS